MLALLAPLQSVARRGVTFLSFHTSLSSVPGSLRCALWPRRDTVDSQNWSILHTYAMTLGARLTLCSLLAREAPAFHASESPARADLS